VVVGAGVLLVSDADEGFLEQGGDGGEDLFAREALELQMAANGYAEGGQGAGEDEHGVELGFLADLAIAGVVAVLLAAALVAAGGLEVAVGVGADPDIGPGGRDGQGLDAGEGGLVAEGFAAGAHVGEAPAGPLAGDARGL